MDRWDETWHRLLEWTNSSGQSERLAAQVLHAEGYEDIDPSHPLGGPDGGRDARCIKDGEPWVMAVYFPRGQKTLATIKTKLSDDLAAAKKHVPVGLAFVTNQELTNGDRTELERVGGDIRVKVYHLERITGLLDRPDMAQVRRQFLGISSGPPPIAVDLEIEGSAFRFTDGTDVRERHIAEAAERAREEDVDKPSNVGYLPTLHLPQYMGGAVARPSGAELERHIEQWETSVRKKWTACEDHLAATGGQALTFRLINNSQALLNDVQVVVTIRGVRGTDWLGPEHGDIDKVLPPVFAPARNPLVGYDSAQFETLRFKDYPLTWKSQNDTVVVTIDLPQLRPVPPWESPGPDVVLLLTDSELTEVTAEWTLTAQGYGEAYYGDSVTIPVHVAPMGELAETAFAAEED
jgi:hypothetical protein